MATRKTCSPIRVGNKVFIRTVTNFYTGEIVEVSEQEIVLKDVAWIADTKRFSESMSTGEFNEVEPYTNKQYVAVARGGIIDVCDWPHDLPRTVR